MNDTFEPEVVPSSPGDGEAHARRASELTALLDLLPDGVMEFDREGRCILLNDGACLILNRTREEWIGKTVADVAPEAVDTAFDSAFQRCRNERVQTSLEQTYYPPRDRWYQSIFSPLAEGVLLHFRDVTHEACQRQAGRVIPLDLQPADLTGICRHVLEEGGSSTRRRSHLSTAGRTSGLWDPSWLAQAISTLIEHALRSNRVSVPIAIEVREAGSDVTLAMHPFGSAASTDPAGGLFEPLRSKESTSPAIRSSGSGFGLFLTKQIIEAHGGTIRVESRAGHSATVIAVLPRSLAPTPGKHP